MLNLSGVWRPAVCAAIAVTAVTSMLSPAVSAVPPTSGGPVSDFAVEFTVRNVNTSRVPCGADGKTYTVRGHVTLPAGADRGRAVPGVLHSHTFGVGETMWRGLNAHPELDHVRWLAREGFASITFNRLGYGKTPDGKAVAGTSDVPGGWGVCFGSDAAVLDQIAGQLRAGTYTAHGHPVVRFSRLAAAGGSSGAVSAKIAQTSFRSFDAIAQFGYAEGGSTVTADDAVHLPQLLGACANTPASGGYERFGNLDRARATLHGVAEPVIASYLRVLEADPCGGWSSVVSATPVNLAATASITVPVLLIYGANDSTVRPGAAEVERRLYAGSRELSVHHMPDTGHYMMLGRTVAQFRTIVRDWLDRHGFGLR